MTVTSVSAVVDRRHQRIAGLFEQARSGERAALNELVAELTPLLWNVARAQGLTVASSEDVVQNTWLNLVRHFSEIRSPLALTQWLVTATRREAWRLRRAERRSDPLTEQMAAALRDNQPAVADQVIADIPVDARN
jgi:DNA-directed RNA polymerase specialized sigma24 family protein